MKSTYRWCSRTHPLLISDYVTTKGSSREGYLIAKVAASYTEPRRGAESLSQPLEPSLNKKVRSNSSLRAYRTLLQSKHFV